MSNRTKTPPPPPPSPAALQRAFSELVALRDQLLALDPDIADDGRLYLDMLEGEFIGDPLDILAGVVRDMLDTDAMIEAIKHRRAELAQRQERFDRRSDTLRRTITTVLQTIGIRSFPQPDFTVTLSPGKGKVLITDEKALADRYVHVVRTPDKAAIGDDLRAKTPVAGAILSNPEPYITVRVR